MQDGRHVKPELWWSVIEMELLKLQNDAGTAEVNWS